MRIAGIAVSLSAPSVFATPPGCNSEAVTGHACVGHRLTVSCGPVQSRAGPNLLRDDRNTPDGDRFRKAEARNVARHN